MEYVIKACADCGAKVYRLEGKGATVTGRPHPELTLMPDGSPQVILCRECMKHYPSDWEKGGRWK